MERDRTRFEAWQHGYFQYKNPEIEYPEDLDHENPDKWIQEWNEIKSRMKEVKWDSGEAKAFKAGYDAMKEEARNEIESLARTL